MHAMSARLITVALALLCSCPERSGVPTTSAAPAIDTAARPGSRRAPASTPPPGSMTLIVNGGSGLTDADRRAVIAHNLPRFRSCYSRALAESPDLCGWVRLRLEYARHGRWSHSGDGSLRDPALWRCLPRKLRAPSKALAAPGVRYDFTLVFAPTSQRSASCGPPGPPGADARP